MGQVDVRGAQGAVARALGAQPVASSSADILVDLGPPDAGDRHARRAAWGQAVERGHHVLACSLDPDDARWAHEQWDTAAADRGVVLLPTAGMAAVIADLLATLGAAACGGATAVHTAHLHAERGAVLAVGGSTLRAEIAALVGRPALVWDNGRLVEEPVGERRRLGWFARPVGPHHAAGIPAPEVVTIPRLHRDVTLVTSHLALRTWQAEVLQALGAASRHDSVGRRVASWVHRERPVVPGARWAIVAEVEGPLGIARAWANGRDPRTVTPAVLSLLIESLQGDRRPRGARTPSQLVDPEEALDALTERCDLRWSVIRPDDAQ